ncbi:hypothetical protein Tco_0889358, partial [Tanacetum coccineum]
MEAKYFRVASIGYMDQLEILIVERAHHERELLIKEKDVKERRENEKRVNEREMRKKERMVNEGTTLEGKCRSPGDDTDVEGAHISKVTSDVDNVVVGASHDKDKLTDVHHSNNEIFENVFAHEIQYREQSDSINDTYVNLPHKEERKKQVALYFIYVAYVGQTMDMLKKGGCIHTTMCHSEIQCRDEEEEGKCGKRKGNVAK